MSQSDEIILLQRMVIDGLAARIQTRVKILERRLKYYERKKKKFEAPGESRDLPKAREFRARVKALTQVIDELRMEFYEIVSAEGADDDS